MRRQTERSKMSTDSYRRSAYELLQQARDELATGDVRQASEEGWGAAAQMLKAIAQQDGEQHHSHAALARVANDVHRQTGEDEIATWFAIAQNLHVNFYENNLSEEFIHIYLNQISLLVNRLDRHLVETAV